MTEVKQDPRFWETVEVVKGFKTVGAVNEFLKMAKEESESCYAIARVIVRCAFGF